ncbi:ketopantoate reductase family protein [Hydrogenophaga sp. A37]|uniref:ketopantoate reductase family protein n=1 Tax=Hydrogenophaga sp. A37 TaxID=1945864 RepID=UPI000984B1E6|nr:2-dehydropantoate 2-reductase [Hydrogenophaga sp. A37]OOG85257.1 2-dehydropantoate 2-reductase [Hydrogenophaga sp. A37]
MNISIVGAGAMGSFFGGLLAEAGHAVTLIDVNEAHLSAIQTQGLLLDTDAGQRRVQGLRACRPHEAAELPDLLMVFTKTLHTTQALLGVRHLIGDRTHVLSLQNGLGNVEKITEYVPIERVLVGVTTWPADLVGPGEVHSHGQGGVRLMSADGRDHVLIATVVTAFSDAGLLARKDEAVWCAIWEKVAFNAALNCICGVSGSTVGQVGDLAESRVLAHAVVSEVLAVAQAHGIAVKPDAVHATVDHALDHHKNHKPSMLQDLLAGRATEIDAICGSVLRQGRSLGVATPLTEAFHALVRLKEASSRPAV